EGRLDHLGLRRRLRAGDLLRAAVRRAAPGAGRQVQPRPVRAVRHDAQPGDPLRQIHRRLHLPVDGVEVPVAGGEVRGGAERRRGAVGGRRTAAAARVRAGTCSDDERLQSAHDDPEPGRRAAGLDVRPEHSHKRSGTIIPAMWTRRKMLGTLGLGALASALPEFASAATPTFPKGAVIRTILKDYAPDELAGGATLFHEHLSFASDFMTRWTGY